MFPLGFPVFAATTHGEAADLGYAIQPAELREVQLRDDFWLPRIERNHRTTLWHAIAKCKEEGRFENFEAAAGVPGKTFRGLVFDDSDVYKIIEGIAYSLQLYPDPKLEAEADRIIELVAAAQEPDGYIQTAYTCAARGQKTPMKPVRWQQEWAHELYDVGHMYEGAVAYFRTTGKRRFLDVAIKSADLVCKTYNDQGLRMVPGHQEIELGLVKLYEATGERKYLEQAKWFLDVRGRADRRDRLLGEYCQDHEPVVDQKSAVGHAVRAGYMYAAMADVNALAEAPGYAQALRNLWNDVNSSKLYVTGGIGSSGSNEGFASGFHLPNLSAYAETCASIANAMWNQRMFQTFADGKYIDVVERALYNAFLSGVGMDGTSFFYPNVLTSLGGAQRSPWFACSCCPSNDVRVFPTIPRWVYSKGENTVFVNLYVASNLETKLGGQDLRLELDSKYPWDGKVALAVQPEKPRRFAIALRIPGWARGQASGTNLYRFAQKSEEPFSVKVNGETVLPNLEKGYVTIEREWKKGDRIELDLPMIPRRVRAAEEVRDDVGKVAIQRGPLVYCAEFADNQGAKVTSLVLSDEAKFASHFDPNLLGGVEVIETHAAPAKRRLDGGVEVGESRPLRLIPYYAWAHRGPGEMNVWHATSPDFAMAEPAPTLARRAKVTTSGGARESALTDQLVPETSVDETYPPFHWWPKKGSTEWVELALAEPATISAVRVFWFQDEPHGECRLPSAWRVFSRRDGAWVRMTDSELAIEKDLWCGVSFDPIQTDAVRIEVDLPNGFSCGMHEVVIE